MPRTMAEIYARHRQMRELYATGQYTERQLSRQFGMTSSNVHNVLAPRGDELDHVIREIQQEHRATGPGSGRKLTDDQVQEIRARYQPHVITARALAEEYGVSRVLLEKIVQNEDRPQKR